MIRTDLCDMFGIIHPIIQAAIWPATAPELVAAVSNAGGLGSFAAVFESPAILERQLARIRELTSQPFVVNHVMSLLNEESFRLTLKAKPAAISLALGDPGELVARAHAAGIKVIHQVHTVRQARQAAERGVDVIIAQGSEAGGQGLAEGVSTMALIPQVVDAVSPIPVLAAGGIADGRGLAAALALGAQGANIGTRFLATYEASAAEAWKQAILAAESEDAIRFQVWQEIFPPTNRSIYPAVPRLLRTPFVETWQQRPDAAKQQAGHLRNEIMAVVGEHRPDKLTPFTGQTAGLIHDILSAAEVVQRIVAEAEQALNGATRLIR